MQDSSTIIFDFGGVILNIDYNKTCKAFESLGVKDFDAMYSQKTANFLFKNLEEGKINEEEFYNAFRLSTQLNLTNDQIKTAWNAMLLSYSEKALQMLEKIKTKYKLYLLSNTNSIHVAQFNKIYLQQVGQGSIKKYFDKTYFSHEINCRKPDSKAYEVVIKENNLSPAATLFIDDSVQNINAAKKLGLQTIYLKEGMMLEDLDL